MEVSVLFHIEQGGGTSEGRPPDDTDDFFLNLFPLIVYRYLICDIDTQQEKHP